MNESLKTFFIKSWAIGTACFVVGLMLALQHFMIGLILGLFNTFIIYPLCNTLNYKEESEKINHKNLLKSTIINVIVAITISLLIRVIDYNILKELIINYPIEPFRFTIMYQTIFYLGYFIINKITKKA